MRFNDNTNTYSNYGYQPPSLAHHCINQWVIAKLSMHHFTSLPHKSPFLILFARYKILKMRWGMKCYAFPVTWIKLGLFFMIMAIKIHASFRQILGSIDFIKVEIICRRDLDQPLQASGAQSCLLVRYDTHGGGRQRSYSEWL